MPRIYTATERSDMFTAVDAMLHNDGIMFDHEGNEVDVVLKDMLTKEDLLPLMQETISHIMLEEIEPSSVIYENFFTELRSTNVNQHLVIHNIGPLTVQPIGTYGEYPETNLAMDQDGQEITLRMQKYGIELRMHDDVVNNNLIPVVTMLMGRTRNAFVRNREKLAIAEMKKQGIVVFDNNNPSGYSHTVKSYSGRDIAGTENGSMSLNDMMEIYVSALMEGYTIDTIAMNPFAWQTFMVDPEMREIVINNNTVVSYRPPQGSGALGRFQQLQGPQNLGLPWGKPYGNESLNPTLAKLGVNPYASTLSLLGASFNIKPSYFPTPLKIVVSPFVPVSKIGNTMVTDIIFAQSGEAGLVLRDGEPVVNQFEVMEKEQVVVRMRESLGFGVLNLGKAVRIAKNAVVARNYVFQNMNSVTLANLQPYSSKGPWA